MLAFRTSILVEPPCKQLLTHKPGRQPSPDAGIGWQPSEADMLFFLFFFKHSEGVDSLLMSASWSAVWAQEKKTQTVDSDSRDKTKRERTASCPRDWLTFKSVRYRMCCCVCGQWTDVEEGRTEEICTCTSQQLRQNTSLPLLSSPSDLFFPPFSVFSPPPFLFSCPPSSFLVSSPHHFISSNLLSVSCPYPPFPSPFSPSPHLLLSSFLFSCPPFSLQFILPSSFCCPSFSLLPSLLLFMSLFCLSFPFLCIPSFHFLLLFLFPFLSSPSSHLYTSSFFSFSPLLISLSPFPVLLLFSLFCLYPFFPLVSIPSSFLLIPPFYSSSPSSILFLLLIMLSSPLFLSSSLK